MNVSDSSKTIAYSVYLTYILILLITLLPQDGGERLYVDIKNVGVFMFFSIYLDHR
jgi:hypothetical protein